MRQMLYTMSSQNTAVQCLGGGRTILFTDNPVRHTEHKHEEKSVDNLSKLRHLTKQLVEFSDIAIKQPNGNVELQEGVLYPLHYEDHMSICKGFFPKGSTIDNHTHNEKEVIGVLEGKAIIVIEDKKIVLNQYDVYVIDPQVPHAIYMEEDTWFWGITMPNSESYPK